MNSDLIARYLFGSCMAVHYLLTNALPGLAFGLVLLQLLSLFAKQEKLTSIILLFVRLFTIQFSIAVISGLTLETDLHQNWSGVGDVLSSLVNHPCGRSAIAGFLLISLLLFILFSFQEKINAGERLGIYLLIFCSSILLSWWAVVVNSWMHTPAGTDILNANSDNLQISITNLYIFIFNPSFLFRFLHIFNAAIIEGLLMQGLIIALVMQKLNFLKVASSAFKIIIGFTLFFLLVQPVIGHIQFAVIAKYQPLKAAAFEGYYKSDAPFHYYITGVTKPEAAQTIGIHLPTIIEEKISSSFEKINGLQGTERSEWPEVKSSFYFFHAMLLCWAGMVVLLTIVAFRWRKEISDVGYTIYFLAGAFALSVIAPLAGWVASESGRQPWIIHGVLKTAVANSYTGKTENVILSTIACYILPLGLVALWVALQTAEWRKFSNTNNV